MVLHLQHSNLFAALAQSNSLCSLSGTSIIPTGRADMSLLEKIIFIADYIEPNREKFEGLEEARRLAYLDLDMAMRYILEETIAFVKQRGRLLHPLSLEALEYYKNR